MLEFRFVEVAMPCDASGTLPLPGALDSRLAHATSMARRPQARSRSGVAGWFCGFSHLRWAHAYSAFEHSASPSWQCVVDLVAEAGQTWSRTGGEGFEFDLTSRTYALSSGGDGLTKHVLDLVSSDVGVERSAPQEIRATHRTSFEGMQTVAGAECERYLMSVQAEASQTAAPCRDFSLLIESEVFLATDARFAQSFDSLDYGLEPGGMLFSLAVERPLQDAGCSVRFAEKRIGPTVPSGRFPVFQSVRANAKERIAGRWSVGEVCFLVERGRFQFRETDGALAPIPPGFTARNE